MCVEIESACKGSGRECVCLERERFGKMESVCRESEGVCREIESACKGSGRVCVFRERESVQRERERKKWKVCAERGKECVLK